MISMAHLSGREHIGKYKMLGCDLGKAPLSEGMFFVILWAL